MASSDDEEEEELQEVFPERKVTVSISSTA
jgi:hypothetical protein